MDDGRFDNHGKIKNPPARTALQFMYDKKEIALESE